MSYKKGIIKRTVDRYIGKSRVGKRGKGLEGNGWKGKGGKGVNGEVKGWEGMGR